MKRAWFITGTDTGVGKTRVACALLQTLQQAGRRAAGMKPVASGCRETRAGPRNADALALLAAGNVDLSYDDVNPYAFIPPTAPHLAARAAGVRVSMDVIRDAYQRIVARADDVVVEGVGGWRVPLAPPLCMSDVVRALDLPVIMVVGIRLGALNHAVLTLESLRSHGVRVRGWIANEIDDDPVLQDYPAALQELLHVPLLARLPYNPATASSFAASMCWQPDTSAMSL